MSQVDGSIDIECPSEVANSGSGLSDRIAASPCKLKAQLENATNQ